MKNYTTFRPVSLFLLAGLIVVAPASGAQTPADSAAVAGSASDDRNVIKLDEFTVNDEQADGYRATNSITATGVGARIMDVPIPINVLTKEFLQDTFVTDMRDAMEYIPGIGTTPRNESEYSVRGFTGNISYRNGQYRRQNYTAWNMDRVEVMKGPAAVFFGSVRDGGVINYLTTRPVLDRRFTELQATVGTEDYYRFGVFHNQPLNEHLAIRLGYGFHDQHGKAQYDYRRENYYGASLLWRINDNHQVVLDLEKVHRNNYMVSSRGYAITNSRYLFNPAVPAGTTVRNWLNSQGYSADPASPNFVPTYDMFAPIFPEPDVYGRYYGFSPDSFEKFKSHAVDLEYLAKFGDNIVWQTTLNYGYDDQPGLRSNNGDREPLADGTVRMRFEAFRNIRDSYNAKTKVTYRFSIGDSNHTLQAGYEDQSVYFDKPGFLTPAGAYSGSLLSDFIIYNPRTDPPLSGFEQLDLAGQEYNVTRHRVEKQSGAYIVNQSRFFRDRLHLLYGVRRNWLSNNRTTYSVPVTNGANTDDLPRPKGWTPQIGVLYQPTPELSLFAVRSLSMEPNFQVDADGNTASPRETTGVDIGVKTDLFAGRVASTLTYYTLDKTNLTTRDTQREIETGRSPWYFYGNTNSSEGIELDLNVAVLDNFQVVLGWSHFIKSEVTESSNPALIGRLLTYTPEDTLSWWSRYTFRTGGIKGLTLGFGARYNAASRMSGDPNLALTLPSYVICDLMVAHNFTVFERNVKAQLNVKNLFDKVYRTGSLGHFAPERSVLLSFSTRL